MENTPSPNPGQIPTEELHTPVPAAAPVPDPTPITTPTPAPTPASAPTQIAQPTTKKYLIPVSIALGALLIIGAGAYYYFTASPEPEVTIQEEMNTLGESAMTEEPSQTDTQNLEELNDVVNDIENILNPDNENLYEEAVFEDTTVDTTSETDTETEPEAPTKVYR